MADIIFIYADQDAARVQDLCAALEKAGVTCDMDRSVPAGQTYAGYMAERLAGAKAAVMCWSAHALATPRLIDEAAAARDAGKIAPVTLDGTLPPLGFGQLQTANLKNWPDEGAKRQLETLASALRRMRDGVDSPATLRSRWTAANRPFILTWKFWILSVLTAAAIGSGMVLTPEVIEDLRRFGSVGERIETFAAFATLALVSVPLSRALLHASRRVLGLASRAFFSTEYLALLAVALAAGAAVFLLRSSEADAGYSLQVTMGGGVILLQPILAALLLVARSGQRLIFGRARAS